MRKQRKIVLIGRGGVQKHFLGALYPESRLPSDRAGETIGVSLRKYTSMGHDSETGNQDEIYQFAESSSYGSMLGQYLRGALCIICFQKEGDSWAHALKNQDLGVPIHIMIYRFTDSKEEQVEFLNQADRNQINLVTVKPVFIQWLDELYAVRHDKNRIAEANRKKDFGLDPNLYIRQLSDTQSNEQSSRRSIFESWQEGLPRSYEAFKYQEDQRQGLICSYRQELDQEFLNYTSSIPSFALYSQMLGLEDDEQSGRKEVEQTYQRQLEEMCIAQPQEMIMRKMHGKNGPLFPLSLYQSIIHDKSYTETISLSPHEARKLVRRTNCKQGVGFNAAAMLALTSSRNLSIKRIMTINNIICGANRYMDYVTSPGEINTISRIDQKQLKNHRAHAWASDSPFMAWREFIASLTSKDMQITKDAPYSNWMSDLKPISFHDPCPIPIYKSQVTGDYWVFGWHGTKARDGVVSSGFKEQFVGANGVRFGPGFYVAVESSKSLSYTGEGENLTLMICAANLGKNPEISLGGGNSGFNSNAIIALKTQHQNQYELITKIPPTLIVEITLSPESPSLGTLMNADFKPIIRNGLQHGDILVSQVSYNRRKYMDAAQRIGQGVEELLRFQMPGSKNSESYEYATSAHGGIVYNASENIHSAMLPESSDAAYIHVTHFGLSYSELVCSQDPSDDEEYLAVRCKHPLWADTAAKIAEQLRAATYVPKGMKAKAGQLTFKYDQSNRRSIAVRQGFGLAIGIFWCYSFMSSAFSLLNGRATAVQKSPGIINFLNLKTFQLGVSTLSAFIAPKLLLTRSQAGGDPRLEQLYDKFFDKYGHLRAGSNSHVVSETCVSFVTLCYQLAFIELKRKGNFQEELSIGPSRASSPMEMIKHLIDSGHFEYIGGIKCRAKGVARGGNHLYKNMMNPHESSFVTKCNHFLCFSNNIFIFV